MLNGLTVYSSLDCTSGYHHIALSPEAYRISAFMTPFRKFEFKKVPFGLAQAPTHFQKLIMKCFKVLLLLLGIWLIFWYLVKTMKNISSICELCLIDCEQQI